jgi:hypothetical protein
MLRVNHIIKNLSNQNPYYPYTYSSPTDKFVKKWQRRFFLTSFVLLVLMVIQVLLYKHTSFFHNDYFHMAFLIIDILCMLSGFIYILLPIVIVFKLIVNWKENIYGKLLCDIDHDEQNATQLTDYSVNELSYALIFIELKIKRLTLRVNKFFGEKTAFISVIGLAYSASKYIGGIDALKNTIMGGLFHSDKESMILVFALAFLLGLSLGALALKKVVTQLIYHKETIELAIHKKQREYINENDER